MSKFSVLCKNQSIVQFNGALVDDGCALASVTQSYIVTRKDHKNKEDFRLLLQSFDYYFTYKTPFEIFNEFNGTKDLLFRVSMSHQTLIFRIKTLDRELQKY